MVGYKYTVTVSNSSGCTGSSSVIIVANPTPNPVITGHDTICSGSFASLDAGSGYSSYLWSTGAITENIHETMPGTYTVTVSNASGCSGMVSVVLYYENTPPTITGPSSIICGDTVTLDVNSSYLSYLWTTNATTQTISVTTSLGTYAVTVSNTSGCTGTATIVVNVDPLTANAGTDKTIICKGTVQLDNVTTNYTGTLTYNWSPSAGLNSNTVINPEATVTTNTKYYVTVTTPGGCFAVDSVNVFVNPLTAYTGTDKTIICGGTRTSTG